MSKVARDYKVNKLLDKQKFSENQISEMSDAQIEYYHWLYFEDSVYDYM
ncbi:BH0509 family protein [Metabacillus halosaccharovorans]|uniref:BH0509 family protein n=1 Tax=Metabacillus halosaccharovorans TaxID=930124 RepID=A0ABT3DFN7_9BACI|nr:BH0509 family protein [Metabacillus halosaccharovorans]MCM3442232.1 BH0509 family protein [Metabacillus halosaccharovorans]MCV9885859.1 BH0509 family protein [Metabacillus halosaccharovorans]